MDSAVLDQAKNEVKNLLITIANCQFDERERILWNELRSLESDSGRQLAIDELRRMYST